MYINNSNKFLSKNFHVQSGHGLILYVNPFRNLIKCDSTNDVGLTKTIFYLSDYCCYKEALYFSSMFMSTNGFKGI